MMKKTVLAVLLAAMMFGAPRTTTAEPYLTGCYQQCILLLPEKVDNESEAMFWISGCVFGCSVAQF